ncbi:MAG: hypothetical protein K0S46_1006 [Moraxellaceae bacterium]|jgi:hypothetical protein|nr:hypothetical protein [Moraxellaceae bacterium]
MRALLAAFSFTLMLLLSACGDSDGAAMGSPTPTTTASSNVVKGVIRNGVVKAMRWKDGIYVQVTSARTGGAGEFSLEIPNPVPGEVLRLDLGVSADTEMLCDAAQCGSASFGEWAPLTTSPGLSTWVSVAEDGSLTVMPMTPVSTLLVRYAEDVGGGHIDATSLEAAQLRVAALFRMSTTDLLARPGNIVDTLWLDAASPEAVKVSLLSAAFAELSRSSGLSIEQVISNYIDAFIDNNGHLLQDGGSNSLGNLYRGADAVATIAGSPDVQAWVTTWIGNAVAALQSGELSTAACAPDCAPFDSNVFIDALGTGENSLGGDLRLVMTKKGAASLEALLAGELAKYGWLASADTVRVGGTALQVALMSVMQSFGQAPTLPEGLTATVEGNTTHLQGVLHDPDNVMPDLTVNLHITLPQVLSTLQGHVQGTPGPFFTFGAVGTMETAKVRASIDGDFVIDASGTDFTSLRTAYTALVMATIYGDEAGMLAAEQSLNGAIAGILRAGEARFTLDGSASLAQLDLQGEALVETSRLAVQGNAWLHVDMKGRSNGGIAANGKVEHGSLTLPSGDHFEVDSDAGHYLGFALRRDGTASAKFAANVLSYAAEASGDGSIAELGTLLTNLRNSVADALEKPPEEGATGDFLTQLLTDLATLQLTVSGQATIPELGHTYTLTIADGLMRISQPDSDAVALALSLGRQGVLARTDGGWWLLGLDLANPLFPAVTLADSSGGEWRWVFDFSGVLVAPPVGELVADIGSGGCYGAAMYC